MAGVQVIVLVSNRRPLVVEDFLRGAFLILEVAKLVAQGGDLVVHLLVLGLVGQKESLALGQGLDLFRGWGHPFLEGQFLKLQELVHGLFRVGGAVAQHLLALLAARDSAVGLLNLALQGGELRDEALVEDALLDLLVVRSRPGGDVPNDEVEQPIDEDTEGYSEAVDQQPLGPGSVALAGRFHALILAFRWAGGRIEKMGRGIEEIDGWRKFGSDPTSVAHD